MDPKPLPRTLLRTPRGAKPLTTPQRLARALISSILAPGYWLAAHREGAPGLGLHLACARFGLSLLFNRQAPLPLGWIHQTIFTPFDSTRYFEFDFMWRTTRHARARRYLDVSSPRLFPILLLRHRPELIADLINPDQHDLSITRQFVNAGGLAARCQLHSQPIESVTLAPGSFDLITCMSVLEHIPNDVAAMQTMWSLLSSGGRMLLTVPCAASASEQYIDYDEYRLLPVDAEGFVFWQRFYDPALLHERLFSIVGEPARCEVYGEKIPGALQANAAQKRADPFYPYWREPYMMGCEFAHFGSVAQLPGEGVVGLEFIKA